jgi:hypothetical protein
VYKLDEKYYITRKGKVQEHSLQFDKYASYSHNEGEVRVLNNPYRLLGIILAGVGALAAPLFYFVVGSVPLAATAISAIILGLTCILLANTRPYISPEACQMLLKTGMENTSALLEELGIRNKAVYLPSALRDGHPQALVPLVGEGDFSRVKDKLPGRLIVRYGPGSDEMAIAVTTAGSLNLDLLPNKPEPTADSLESSLNYILTGVLDIASGVTVNMVDSRVNVEVSGAKLTYENIWYYRCLGSPLASIAAAITCEALDKPVRIVEENGRKGKSLITLEILP